MKIVLPILFTAVAMLAGERMTWSPVSTPGILASVSSASRPVYVANGTQIFVDATGAAISTTILCPAGAALAWDNDGTNEIEWSTNGHSWIPTNVRWCKSQAVTYYVNPSNATMFYRKVAR